MTNAGRLSAAPGDLVYQDQSQDPTLQPDTNNIKMESDSSSSSPPSQQQQQQATASSSSGSECNSGQNTPVTVKQETMDHDSKDNEQEVDDNNVKQEGKRPEYTMDAVLTLMQLNAGWRE